LGILIHFFDFEIDLVDFQRYLDFDSDFEIGIVLKGNLIVKKVKRELMMMIQRIGMREIKRIGLKVEVYLL